MFLNFLCTVFISGIDLFGHGDNITSVMFGDIPATIDFSRSTSTLINVRIQPNTKITRATPVYVSVTSNTYAIVNSSIPIWTYLAQGVVTDIQPPTGQEGTRVTITGTNLLGGGNNAVQILLDNVQARIESLSNTKIEVVMCSIDSPKLKSFPGQAVILANTGATVTGGSYIHQSSRNIVELFPKTNRRITRQTSGTITDFFPRTGRRGTMITVTGQGLVGIGESITAVMIAGNFGIVVSFNSSQVVVQAGPGVENDEGPIQLTINTGTMITSVESFTYLAPGVVSDIIPPEGTEGAIVYIRGSALFSNNTQLATVTVGGISVSRIISARASEISILVGAAPTSNPMMAEIIITASDGSFVDGVFFRFINLSISLPGRMSGREGTLLDIALPDSPQFDITTGLTAMVDDEVAGIVSTSTGLITVQVPRAKRDGTFTADVAIENSERLVVRLPDGFTYLPEGEIYIISPNFGQRGTRVVLGGENLLGGGAVIFSGMLSGIPARVLSSSEQRVEIEILENPPASTVFPLLKDILLTADTGAITLRLNCFTFIQPGDIQMISPTSGQVGTRVAITGTGLVQGGEDIQQVTLAGTQATVIENASDTNIRVEASSSNPLFGPVEILLITGAIITSEQTFVYLQEGVIDILIPNHGTEGTQVQIEGSNLFGGGSSVQRVLLNGVEAVIDLFTDSRVAVIAQAGEPGFGGVEIVSDTGARVVRAFSWTYTELGSITSIEPPIGQQGIDVTLEGMRLLGSSGTSVTECRLAGILGTVVTLVFSRSSVICRAGFFPNLISQPANGTGPAEVVTNTGVVIRSEPNVTFTYYVAQIDTVTPSTGNNGTIVSISGINLVGSPSERTTVTSVEFGGIEATILTLTDNSVTVRAGLSTSATQDSTVRVISTGGSFLELNDAWNFSPLKQIVSISPIFAFPGDSVIITGINLSSSSNVEVIVGQTKSPMARIISDTAIEFVAGVHQSTDNAREPLPLQIVYSTGETVFEPSVTFTYNDTLGIIDSVSPNAGAENTTVKITGQNLLGDQVIAQVYLAGVAVTSIQGTPTNEEIVVLAGAGPNEGRVGTVVIERSSGIQFGLSGNAWRYYPRLNSTVVSPSSGQNGTIVTINLFSVNPLPAILNITLVGTPALDFSVAPNRSRVIIATVKTTNSTVTSVRGDVVIFFANSTQLTIKEAWTYLESVQVTSFDPRNMQGYFNSLVTLNGQNFQAGGRVDVNSVYLAGFDTQIVSQSDLQLQVRITEFRNSSSQSFQGPVVIVSDQGATYTSSENFTYVQVRVDSVDPQQGQRGTRVTITGVGLLFGGISVNNIMFGNISAIVNSATNNEIIVSAGEFPSQTDFRNIVYRVNTEAELTIPDSWRYIVPGEITSVSPRVGGPGTIATIRGTNLFGGGTRAMEVLLNNIPAQRIINNFDTFIQVVAGSTTRGNFSAEDVVIMSDTGATTSLVSSTSYETSPGKITMVEPTVGQIGTKVRIEGMALHTSGGDFQICLANVLANFISESSDERDRGSDIGIYVVRAGSPPMKRSFSGPVTIATGINGTCTQGATEVFYSSVNFTYLSEGDVHSVTPDRGQVGQYTTVTIEGRNLLGGGTNITNATLAGTPAIIIGIPTNSLVILRANPAQEAVLGDIVIESNTGAYVQRVDGWRYVENGSIITIQPRQGQWGTRIVINGNGLLLGGNSLSRALLGNIELEIIADNATRIEVRVGAPTLPDSFSASNITLVSDCDISLTQNIEWLFLNQSRIETILPPSGFKDTKVTIFGTNLLGGGSRIVSAVLHMAPAEVVSANSSQVVLIAGFNSIAQVKTGDVELVSDTGAITVKKNGWTYKNECSQGYVEHAGSCVPCDTECLGGCSGPSPFECMRCRGASFVFHNDHTLCVTTCDPDSATAYSNINCTLNFLFEPHY